MDRRRALLAALAGGALTLGALAQVAGAHPSFDLASVPADSTERLELHLPVESADPAVDNEEVVLHLPDEFEGVGCLPSFGWTCEVDDTFLTDVVVRWERAIGSSSPEAFVLVVATPVDQGVYRFPVEQHRSDVVIRWDDEPRGVHPAPRLRVTAEGSDPEPTTAPPPSHAPTSTPPSTTPPPPTSAGGPAPTTAGPAPTTVPPTTATAAPTTSIVDGERPAPTSTTDILEEGPLEAVPPGEVTLGLPEEEGEEPNQLTPARVAVGTLAGVGALLTWLLLRRANQPV